MRIIKVENYDEMSRVAADILAAQVILKPDSVLGLATGSTPIGLYKNLIKKYENKELDFSAVKSANLDEYVGLTQDNDQSYYYFMHENLFNHINIDEKNVNIPSGVAEDIEAECERYENVIDELGGVDIQLLGIGHDGHIGFNEPEETFPKKTHSVVLNEMTIKANSRFFESEDLIPRKAVTMGIGTIMKAKKILLVASGEDKKEILKKSLFGPVDPQVPASILQLHNDVIIVTDCDLA